MPNFDRLRKSLQIKTSLNDAFVEIGGCYDQHDKKLITYVEPFNTSGSVCLSLIGETVKSKVVIWMSKQQHLVPPQLPLGLDFHAE